MELFTTIALTVGVFVLIATWITAFLMIKTDTFTKPRVAPAAASRPLQGFDNAPRELVNS